MKKSMSKAAAAVVATTILLTGCGKEATVMEPTNAPAEEASIEASVEASTEEVKEESAAVATTEAPVVEEAEETYKDESGYEYVTKLGGEELTEEEVLDIQEYLSGKDSYGFALSTYDSPSEIDWHEVFYGGAGIENCDYSQEALNAYFAASEYFDSIEYDLLALSGQDVRSFVEAKTGIKDFDLNNIGFIYVPEYDILFAQISDTNYVHMTCVGGVKKDDQIKVVVDLEDFNNSTRCITLKKTEDPKARYQFISCHDIEAELEAAKNTAGEASADFINIFPAKTDNEKLLVQFLNNEVPAAGSYGDKSSSFYRKDLPIDFEDALGYYYYSGTLDLDNDGEQEAIIYGPYGGMCLDAYDGEVFVMAAGEGTALELGYCKYNGQYYVYHSDTMHSGRMVHILDRYDNKGAIAETVRIEAVSETDQYDESHGKYYINDAPITYAEYTSTMEAINNTPLGVYSVKLEEVGPNSVLVIKAIRECLGTTLTEAKYWVDVAPSTFQKYASNEEAQFLKTYLESFGAKVTISEEH